MKESTFTSTPTIEKVCHNRHRLNPLFEQITENMDEKYRFKK